MRREFGRSLRGERKQRLGPWLSPGDIVIMDNLSIHKMLVVRD